MVLRFRNMLAAKARAERMINRACRDLSCSSFSEFGRLKEQFHIMDNLDVYIDDSMKEEYYGYILKCLRAVGLLSENAEVIVPSSIAYDSVIHYPVAEAFENDDEPDDDNIINIEDLLPDEAFDDGHFWDEYGVEPDDDDE